MDTDLQKKINELSGNFFELRTMSSACLHGISHDDARYTPSYRECAVAVKELRLQLEAQSMADCPL